MSADTAWARGRFDARDGPGRILFGQMYEDASVERQAFGPAGRIFCIASAGCTAMALAPHHEVVAVDINPVQLAYAERRFEGEPARRGVAERYMTLGRAFGPLAGWWPSRVGRFLQLDDIAEQTRFWREHLDTARFRAAVDGLLSLTALRRLYATRFLDFLPPRLGAVMRARLARGFAAHPNRSNPFARSLLLGELAPPMPPIRSAQIRFERADAASFLERQPHGSFDGFALSNILDGAGESYAHRLHAAVRRAATPRATVVQRSFREPRANDPNNRAGDDRSMLWGIVDVRRAAQHS